jgi:hypothetical protein
VDKSAPVGNSAGGNAAEKNEDDDSDNEGDSHYDDNDENLVTVVVQDSGIGIPEDHIPLLFQELHAGRHLDDAQVRRIGSGPGHLQAPVPAHARPDRLQLEEGPGLHLLVHSSPPNRPRRRESAVVALMHGRNDSEGA